MPPNPPVAVIDFETTGFSPAKNDRVLEIGVVLLDECGQHQYSWTTLVNPVRDVGATWVHGIAARELLDAPRFEEVVDDLLSLLDGRALVAHNAPFDMNFLRHELSRSGYALPDKPPALCSMKWSRRVLGVAKLAQCCEAVGVSLTNAHAALDDAIATAELYRHLQVRAGDRGDWKRELHASLNFELPYPKGAAKGHRILRGENAPTTPSAWIERINVRGRGTPSSTDENVYLRGLRAALLDLGISETEGRQLASLANRMGLSRARVRELHQTFLELMAAETWSDGICTVTEGKQMAQVAVSLGLAETDAVRALKRFKAVRVEPQEVFLRSGDRVVFTGRFSVSRSVLVEQITAAGLTTGGITKSTKLVVAADPDSLSRKAQNARASGVAVVDEAGFRRLFREYLESPASG